MSFAQDLLFPSFTRQVTSNARLTLDEACMALESDHGISFTFARAEALRNLSIALERSPTDLQALYLINGDKRAAVWGAIVPFAQAATLTKEQDQVLTALSKWVHGTIGGTELDKASKVLKDNGVNSATLLALVFYATRPKSPAANNSALAAYRGAEKIYTAKGLDFRAALIEAMRGWPAATDGSSRPATDTATGRAGWRPRPAPPPPPVTKPRVKTQEEIDKEEFTARQRVREEARRAESERANEAAQEKRAEERARQEHDEYLRQEKEKRDKAEKERARQERARQERARQDRSRQQRPTPVDALAAARKVLGVSADATPDQIKAAYRKKARENHPDKGGSNEKIVEINNARDLLIGRY